jgi:quercetin dioxygenase-like cupin family protein
MSLQTAIIPSIDGRTKPSEPVPPLNDVPSEVIDEALSQIVEENEKKRGAWVFPWEVILAYVMRFGDWPLWTYVKRRRSQLSPPGQQGVYSSFVSIFGRAAKQDFHAHEFQTELFFVHAGILRLWIEEDRGLVQYELHRGDLAQIPCGVFHRSEVLADPGAGDGEEPAVLVVKSPNAHPDVPGYKITKPFPAV